MEIRAEVVAKRIRRAGERCIGALRERFSDSSIIAAGVGFLLMVGALFGVGVLAVGDDSSAPPPSPPVFEPSSSTSTTLAQVLVHAAGAVRQPGLHRLPAGSRIADLIEAAGGVDDMVDIDRVNLAAPVTDGERVYVPRRGELIPAESGSSANLGGTPAGVLSPIDLNTATQQQLDDLPGVGPSTAAAILAERTARGRFSSVDDLLDVRGIGTAKLEQLRSLVTIR